MLALRDDPRQRNAVRVPRRKQIIPAALLLLLAGVCLAWQSRPVQIEGRLALRGWDGGVVAPVSGRGVVMPVSKLRSLLRGKMQALDVELAAAELRCDEARRLWVEKSAARVEAMRVLRVAERANAADLVSCRERHAEAAMAADEALAVLERRNRQREALFDPAALLADLPAPTDIAQIGEDGLFTLKARAWHRPLVVVVQTGDAKDGAGQVWLRAVEVSGGQTVQVEFSNADILTMQKLKTFAGVPRESGL